VTQPPFDPAGTPSATDPTPTEPVQLPDLPAAPPAASDRAATRRVGGGPKASVTVGLDGSTTYHQQAPASSSDVTVGDKVQVQLTGDGVRAGQDAGGNPELGIAGDVTIVP
jgi:hypothetical protein